MDITQIDQYCFYDYRLYIANIHLGAAIRGHFGDLGQLAAGHSLQPLGAGGIILEMRESYCMWHFCSNEKTLLIFLC